MKGSALRICLGIVRELKLLPAASLFLHPVDPDQVPNYYEIIDDPQDLSTIESRLVNHDYRSVAEWKRDMSRMWDNAAVFGGPRSLPAQLAGYLRQVTDKKLKALSTANLCGWLTRVSELTELLKTRVSNPPENIRVSAPIEMLANMGLEPFFPEDYDLLFGAMANLPTEDDRQALKKVLKKPNTELDLTLLPLTVLHRAKEFVREKLPGQKPSIALTGRIKMI
jgi:hypothetical protein